MPPRGPHEPGWRGALTLDYCREGARTVARHKHEGPFRVLKALHPEGEGICHHVVVHPPGGIVGGDTLQAAINVGAGSHALLTTPGATRFYRSGGAWARQHIELQVQEGARLEWLPLETIIYNGALAQNHVSVALAGSGSTMGWDLVCLGLPASRAGFDAGTLHQHLEVKGHWLERATIHADDTRLRKSRLGLAGCTVMATFWCAWGHEHAEVDADLLLNVARDVVAQHQDAAQEHPGPGELLPLHAGVTQAQPGVLVLRALGQHREVLWALLRDVRRAWRRSLWSLEDHEPRVWSG